MPRHAFRDSALDERRARDLLDLLLRHLADLVLVRHAGALLHAGGAEEEDRRQKILRLTPRGHAVLRVVDRARAEQFLSAVRPMPTAERALIAMGVAALATHAISRRGRLIRNPAE